MRAALGFGKDGNVFASSMATAIKAHARLESYEREVLCYLRLAERAIIEVCGHHVPQLIDFDDQLLIIEMTIVTRPFVLDFAGAYIDAPPDFPDDVLDQWRTEKAEESGERWPDVLSVMSELQQIAGIHLFDLNRGNIGF